LGNLTIGQTGASTEVKSYIRDIQADTHAWSYSAKLSLNALERALSDLETTTTPPEPFDFSMTLDSVVGDYDATLPAPLPVAPWTPDSKAPSYDGETTCDVGSNPVARPGTIDLTVVAPAAYVAPSQTLYTPIVPEVSDLSNDIVYTDPGDRPVSSAVDPVALYVAPEALSPDLNNIRLPGDPPPTAPTAPDFATLVPTFDTTPTVTPLDWSDKPSAPAGYDAGSISWDFNDSAPSFDTKPPTIDYSGAPGAFEPDTVPTPVELTPVTPATYDPPDNPEQLTLTDVVIPDVPDIDLTDFEPITTNFGELDKLEGALSYQDDGFSDGHLAELVVDIKRVLAGNVGLPPAIWDAIWDKASAQITRAGVARERQGRQAWAKLGWSMPGGVALAQQEQAAFDINQQLSDKAKEQAIQRAVMSREDFWKAMEQGVTAEKLLRDHYHAFQERQLKAQIAMVETMVAVYNANVSRYNANVASTQALIALRDQEIRTLMVPLDVAKARIEGAGMQVQAQGQKLQNQALKWEQVKLALQQYTAEIESKKNELLFQAQRLELFGSQVKLRETEVLEWSKKWDGYASKIEAQKAISSTFSAEVASFAERVKGYTATVEAERSKVLAEAETERFKIEAAKYELEEFNAKWEHVLKTNSLLSQRDDTAVKLYSAGVQKSATVAQANTQVENLRLESFKSEVSAYQAKLEDAARRASAIATYYGAEAARYQADAAGAKAAIDASATRVQAQASVVDAEARAYSAAVEGEKTSAQMDALVIETEMKHEQIAWENQKQLAEASALAYDAAHKGAVAAVEASRHISAANAQNQSVKAAEASANAQAYSAGAQQLTAETNANAKAIDAAIAATQAEIAVYDAETKREAARLQSDAQVASADASRANARSSWAESKVRSQAVQLQAEAEQAKLDQTEMIEEAKLQMQKLLQLSTVQIRGLESISQIYAQLVAGAYSAANISASIGDSYSGSMSGSVGCSENTNINFEGVAED
jgi:hypothetical protein